MDYNIFAEKVASTAKALKLDVKGAALNGIARAMSVTDPEAAPVVKKQHTARSKDVELLETVFGISPELLADYGYTREGYGYIEYEADSDLRDTEKIPVKENIYE